MSGINQDFQPASDYYESNFVVRYVDFKKIKGHFYQNLIFCTDKVREKF